MAELAPAATPSANGSRRSWLLFLLASILTGVALRLHQLPAQIVADDEMHSLRALLSHSYVEVFSRFFEADACIPQTLIAKAIADSVGLDELSYRLPSLAAGIALLVLLPWLSWRRFGPAAASCFALLLAISPLLIFYSRWARPYAACALFVSLALIAFERWLEQEGRRAAAVYVASAIAAIWFHVLAAPAVLAPISVGLWELLRSSEHRARSVRRLAWMTGCIGAGAGLLLAAPVWVSSGAMLSKVGGGGVVSWPTLLNAFRLLSGSGQAWLTALFAVGLLWGMLRTARLQPRWTRLVLVAWLAQLAVLAVADPAAVQFHWVLVRYSVWLLPTLLLFLAVGVAELGRLAPARAQPASTAALSVALGAALYFGGPLPETYATPNNFTNHSDFQRTYRDDGWRTRAVHISEFYRRLADDPRPIELVETPWYYYWGLSNLHHYQAVHRKPVRIGFVARLTRRADESELPLSDPRLRFQRFVDLAEPERFDPSIRYVVVHRDLTRELGRGVNVPAIELAPVLAFCRSHFGAPVFEDDELSVFEVSGDQAPH